MTIRDFLWCDETGLPVKCYTESDVKARAEEVYGHVYRVYPTIHLHTIVARFRHKGII